MAAPNPFKGSLSASQAAVAIARGIRQVFGDAEVAEVPMADGGEGTTDALVRACHGDIVDVTVTGPLREPVQARLGLIADGSVAVAELAQSSGLTLVPPENRDPLRTTSYGLGELLDAARRRGARRIIVGVGGSATNDGGAGLAQALGYRLLDSKGHELEQGGGALLRLSRIDPSGVDQVWDEIDVRIAADVMNPLCGPTGASCVYGPQKGGDRAAVQELDRALAHLADVLGQTFGVDVRDVPGAGAGGGAGAGLMAFLGGQVFPGAGLVADEMGLDLKLLGSEAVFTGEGCVDGQTSYGKGPFEVIRRAKGLRVPTIVLAGSLGAGWEDLIDSGAACVLPIAEGPSSLDAMCREAPLLIERAVARACRLVAAQL